MFGLLYNKRNVSIGEDTKTYAVAQLLPSVDTLIDREHLDEFISQDKKAVAVIMNHNYTWSKWCWPPSKYIYPCFLGFRYGDFQNTGDPTSSVETEFLEGMGKEYLQSYGSVGCEDLFTVNTLKKQGIKSHFSGCLTLTLPKQEETADKNSYICLVDLQPDVAEKIKKDVQVLEVREFVDKVQNKSKMPWSERQEKVKNRLTVYQNARCVVTSNLYCALPCLAMNVPVLFVEKNNKMLSPYYNYLRVTSPDKILKGKAKFDFVHPTENSKKYLVLREKLLKDCKEFVENFEKIDKNPDNLYPLNYTEKQVINWRHDIMKKSMDKWLLTNRVNIKTITVMNDMIRENKEFEKRIANNDFEIPMPKGFFRKIGLKLAGVGTRIKSLFTRDT